MLFNAVDLTASIANCMRAEKVAQDAQNKENEAIERALVAEGIANDAVAREQEAHLSNQQAIQRADLADEGVAILQANYSQLRTTSSNELSEWKSCSTHKIRSELIGTLSQKLAVGVRATVNHLGTLRHPFPNHEELKNYSHESWVQRK